MVSSKKFWNQPKDKDRRYDMAKISKKYQIGPLVMLTIYYFNNTFKSIDWRWTVPDVLIRSLILSSLVVKETLPLDEK